MGPRLPSILEFQAHALYRQTRLAHTAGVEGARNMESGKGMARKKQIIGGPLVVNGRRLSLSRAVRAGDLVYLTGQIPMRDGAVMSEGAIEVQTRNVLDHITATLADAGCTRDDVVKAMVWLRERADFAGFNAVYGEYFPKDPPARSAVLNDLLVDVRVEVEVVAYRPV
jgi:reactive intermediate/imine deaminase